jgi:hypothetical protein
VNQLEGVVAQFGVSLVRRDCLGNAPIAPPAAITARIEPSLHHLRQGELNKNRASGANFEFGRATFIMIA